MPTYEYQCTSCGHQFEQFQMMTDEPVKICPECQHEVRRLLGTGAGFIMKGGGAQQPAASCCGQGHGQDHNHEGGQRCCGREERCDRPPCHA